MVSNIIISQYSIPLVRDLLLAKLTIPTANATLCIEHIVLQSLIAGAVEEEGQSREMSAIGRTFAVDKRASRAERTWAVDAEEEPVYGDVEASCSCSQLCTVKQEDFPLVAHQLC